MVRAALARSRLRARRAWIEALTSRLERATERSPIIVPEYSLRPRPRWGWNGPVPVELATVLEEAEDESAETIDAVLSMAEWCATVPRSDGEGSPDDPCWDNSYWGGLDAVVQVAELRRRNPALYLEVGSGFSTRFARRAIDDFGLRTKIISIDPQPRAEIDRLCDEVIRKPAEDVETAIWELLGPGDILLIDGSHTALMNSDATVLICEVLPRLPRSVMVAIDDIFLPWDYPPTWERRWYGEQYLVAALLLGGRAGWRLTFPGWHLTRPSPTSARFEELWPLVETRFGRDAVSFWMERA